MEFSNWPYLPVAPTGGNTAKVRHRAELNVDTLATVLLSHRLAARIHERTVPGGGNVDRGGEGGDEVSEADAERRVLKAEALPAEARKSLCWYVISTAADRVGSMEHSRQCFQRSGCTRPYRW
jgi:hypothetical protein